MHNPGVATGEAMGVGFEDGPCLSSPTPEGSVPQFPHPEGAPGLSFLTPGGSGPQFPHHRRAPGLSFPTPQRMPDGFDSVPLKTSSSSTDREL